MNRKTYDYLSGAIKKLNESYDNMCKVLGNMEHESSSNPSDSSSSVTDTSEVLSNEKNNGENNGESNGENTVEKLKDDQTDPLADLLNYIGELSNTNETSSMESSTEM